MADEESQFSTITDFHANKVSLKEESLSCDEVLACAYCAGWAEARSAVVYDVNVDLVCMEIGQFVTEVSRGGLVIPHLPTFELISVMAFFVKMSGSLGGMLGK